MSSISWYSDLPSLLQLLISIRSTTSLCSPEEPLAWQFIPRAMWSISLKPILLINLGRRICTEDLMQVPIFDGQHVTIPRMGSYKNTFSSSEACLRASSMLFTALENLLKTALISPPSSIEIIRRWSPSLIHIRNF